jgi:hypothetical protein
VQGRDQQHLAVLEQALPDLFAGARQVIKRVQVDVGGHRHDDTDYPVSNAFPLAGATAKVLTVFMQRERKHEKKGGVRLRIASQSLRH